MTREEAVKILKECRETKLKYTFYTLNEYQAATDMAIKALEQEPCDDAVSRQAVNKLIDELARAISDERCFMSRGRSTATIMQDILDLPSVSTEKTGRCKDCKYLEYDSVAQVDGIPLIVAHEICTTWGDGCKTRENGYCFMYTPKMQEVEE